MKPLAQRWVEKRAQRRRKKTETVSSSNEEEKKPNRLRAAAIDRNGTIDQANSLPPLFLHHLSFKSYSRLPQRKASGTLASRW
jgi:hypothetical protein